MSTKWNTYTLAGLMATSLMSSPAHSKTIPAIQNFITTELTRMEAAPPLAPGSERLESLSDYQLSLFRLRIKAEVGFDAGIGKITLEPVAEFFWE